MRDLRQLLAERLDAAPPGPDARPEHGDYDLNTPAAPEPPLPLRPAGVLVPLIERGPDVTVLFTRRADHLPRHAGQVSFPGGGVLPSDGGPVGAALRETHEEVGVAPDSIEIAGYLGLYRTVTDFCVLPVVGFVPSGAALTPDPNEVTEIFEAPLEFLMNPDNHQIHSREWNGRRRYFYAIPYKNYYIWGATAAMLVDFHRRVFAPAQRAANREAAS